MTSAIPERTPDEIEYPSSDGRPVGETDLHIDELITLRFALRRRYEQKNDIYVAGNLLVYYEKGNPRACVSPDVFVVFGVPSGARRVFKIWVEGAAPSFVMEFTSKSTWLEDVGTKKAVYARLGVAEYFLFDPEAEYLDPSFQAFRLTSGEYRRIEPRADGGIESRELGIVFYREGQRLRAIDQATNSPLLRLEELGPSLAAAERARNDAESARKDAERRANDAEAELSRLRAEIAKTRGS